MSIIPHINITVVMTMDALASVHVLVTLTFVNMPTQRMPNDLSHIQGCPAAVLRLCYFGYLRKYARLSSLSPIHAAEKPIRFIPA